jgi:CBS domain-containing protein
VKAPATCRPPTCILFRAYMQDAERPSSHFERYTVSDFMSRTGIAVGPHATLADAETYFEKYDFNLLPVVDRLRLMGVLTKTDFLKAFCARQFLPPPPSATS